MAEATLLGKADLDSETLMACGAGYRTEPAALPYRAMLRWLAVETLCLTKGLKGPARCLEHGSIALALAFALLCAEPATSGESGIPKEYQLKAAFLFNFAKFVEWPAQRFHDASTPLVIGVFGINPFASELESAVTGRQVNGRTLVVKRVAMAEDAKTTHLLFVPAAEDDRVREVLQALDGASVLTVGESEEFSEEGGMIRFLLEGDKLRFEINAGSAERAALQVSAQLQKLAKSVHR